MAQTTSAMTGAMGKVEYSTDGGTTWTNLSGSTQSIDVVEFTRLNGSAYTFDGDTAVLTFGKQPPVTVTVNSLYTETAGESFLVAVSAIKNNTAMMLRWQAADAGATTYLQFSTLTGGKVSSVSLPGNDASSGEPLMFSFSVMAPGVTYVLVEPAP